MCILLYMKVIWCNVMPYIYFQLEWGYMYLQYMCILINHRYIVNWSLGGIDVSSVYVLSAICETYLVQQYSIDVLSIWDVDVSSVYVH